jgi:hypothetical protein
MTGDTARRQDRADLARECNLRRDGIVRGGTGRGDEQEQKGGAGRDPPCRLPPTFCVVRYRPPPPGFVSVIGVGAATGLKSRPVYCISSHV